MTERPLLVDTLMRLVLNAIIFLGLSGEDIVDERSAVKMLDYTAYELKRLSPEDRRVFLDYARRMAAEQQRPEVRGFLLSLGTDLLHEDDQSEAISQ